MSRFTARLAACLAVVTGLIACEPVAHVNDFNHSQQAWHGLRADCDRTYWYRVDQPSFGGWQQSTWIQVEDGTPVARWHHARDALGSETQSEVFWSEGADSLGQNDGPAPVNIDTLYARCLHDVLTADPQRNEIIFETHDSGLLATCTARPRGCLDDCADGVRIAAFGDGQLGNPFTGR